MSFTIHLPYPPSTNNLYSYRNKGVYKSKQYKNWKKDCGWIKAIGEPIRRDADYKVSIVMVPPDNRRRDLDNIIKPALDMLQDLGLTPDDKHCVEIQARKVGKESTGFVSITAVEVEA